MSNEALVKERSCIDCAVKNCDKMDKSYPEFCLTTNLNQEVYREAMACYDEEENHKTMVAAAKVEYEHYCQYTRVEEIMAFAREIGAKKIGIATCVGLLKESRTLAAIMRAHGFEEVNSPGSRCLGLRVRQALRLRVLSGFRKNVTESGLICAIQSCRQRC